MLPMQGLPRKRSDAVTRQVSAGRCVTASRDANPKKKPHA
jgi:hypothetical protein